MNELSLFTGAGGGVLGSILLGWHTVGYVEWDDYCQRVIAQRIADGCLPSAPIFGDVRAFVRDGYAAAYTGLVDVVSGGFPCQPFSVAGQRAGADDPRNMWPATRDVVRIVRPRFAFLENVPGLLSSGYFGRVLGDLAEIGYDAEWTVLGADDVGAPHRRKRLWILAYAQGERGGTGLCEDRTQRNRNQLADGGQFMADTTGWKIYKRERTDVESAAGFWPCKHATAFVGGADVSNAHNPGREKQREPVAAGAEHAPAECGGWWQSEPGVGRMVDGLAAGMDQHGAHAVGGVGRVATGVLDRAKRLTAIGNGQVPACAAKAWTMLMRR